MSAWLDFPQTITAMSPHSQTERVTYRLAKGDLLKAAKAGRYAPAFEMWSVLLGKAPPVPNIGDWNSGADSELTCLADAHACFRGVQRPLAEDDDGSGVLSYIIRPSFLYRFEASMRCVAVKKPIRKGLLYVAHIRLDHPEDVSSGHPRGVFTHGGFVEADPSQPLLPIDHKQRYSRRHW